MDRTLTDTTNPVESGPGSNNNEVGTLYFPKIFEKWVYKYIASTLEEGKNV